MKSTLARLISDTNVAIAAAREADIQDAVNWADLKCIGAEWATGLHPSGQEYAGYSVVIEEASPGAAKFRIFISEHLAKLGWVGVGVSTEW
jgi:hypothetical protein